MGMEGTYPWFHASSRVCCGVLLASHHRIGLPHRCCLCFLLDSFYCVMHVFHFVLFEQVLAPRVVQAVIAAIADTFLFRIVDRYNPRLADLTLYCNAFCWFMFYCDVRTFSNTMEAQLCIIALYYWLAPRESIVPDDDDSKNKESKDADGKEQCEYIDDTKGRVLASTLSGLAFVMRPTAAIFLAPVVILHLVWTFKAMKRSKITFGYVFCVLMLQMALPVITVVAISTAVDSVFYGEFTFVPFNFLYHNVLHSVADFYGTHSWHWYFTQGFPFMLGPFVLLFVLGLFSSQGLPYVLLFLCIWPIAVFSVLKHKEFRFVLTSLYIAMPYCAAGMETLRFKKKLKSRCASVVTKFISWSFVILLFVIQLIAGYFFCYYYQRGPIAVMDTLTEIATMPDFALKQLQLVPVKSVAFLCECHSTPYYAYVHTRPGLTQPPFEMKFLDCTPDFAHNLSTEFVEDRIFQRNPRKFVFDRYVNAVKGHKREELPSYIVSFTKYDKELESFYTLFGYKVCAVFPNDFEGNMTLRFLKPEPPTPNPDSPFINRNMFANDDDDDDPLVQSLTEEIVRPTKEKRE